MPRRSPLDLDAETFRRLGHRAVDRLADLLATLPSRPVTSGRDAAFLRNALGQRSVPEEGADPETILDDVTTLLIEHSLYNGHPRFMGYITASPAPLGSLSELVAATVNPNCGSFSLSPVGTLIEEQVVSWMADLLRLPATSAGLLVSGGNMANMVGFWAARTARARANVREEGLRAESTQRLVYCSAETHTWIQKAADLSGLGTRAIRWIPVDGQQRMRIADLETQIDADTAAGFQPFLVVGTGGTVGTGAVDPLSEMARVCRERGLWFHVDGAYGAPAILAAEAPSDLHAMAEADSVAFDPHKWLYAPLEAGCVFVRDPAALKAAFSYHPAYYHFDSGDSNPPPNFYELGPQNSRGFRALKVWLAIRQAGRKGYAESIGEDIRLARELFDRAAAHPELEAVTHNLSITTFRYVPPPDVRGPELQPGHSDQQALNALNETILTSLQQSGRAYVSNAVVDGRYLLRACIVNFRTTSDDVRLLLDSVVEIGRSLR
jgi:glutamate/tyrosine decarboxylase-like PLP-dependent enzyme